MNVRPFIRNEYERAKRARKMFGIHWNGQQSITGRNLIKKHIIRKEKPPGREITVKSIVMRSLAVFGCYKFARK